MVSVSEGCTDIPSTPAESMFALPAFLPCRSGLHFSPAHIDRAILISFLQIPLAYLHPLFIIIKYLYFYIFLYSIEVASRGLLASSEFEHV